MGTQIIQIVFRKHEYNRNVGPSYVCSEELDADRTIH